MIPIEPAVIPIGRKRIYSYLRLLSIEWFIQNKIPTFAEKMYDFRINERITEYPFVHSNIKMEKGKILEVGCGNSILSLELASSGHSVWALDLRRYPYSHNNLVYVQEDIRNTSFSDEFFDRIIAVSSIEHIGIENKDDQDGDKMALKEIFRILKYNGKLILTLPFGKRAIADSKGEPLYRVYDKIMLDELISLLKIEHIEYAARKENCWNPVSLSDAKDMDSTINIRGKGSPKGVNAVAMVVARKE